MSGANAWPKAGNDIKYVFEDANWADALTDALGEALGGQPGICLGAARGKRHNHLPHGIFRGFWKHVLQTISLSLVVEHNQVKLKQRFVNRCAIRVACYTNISIPLQRVLVLALWRVCVTIHSETYTQWHTLQGKQNTSILCRCEAFKLTRKGCSKDIDIHEYFFHCQLAFLL